MGWRVDCVQTHTVFAYLTKGLEEAVIVVPGGIARELLPGFTDHVREFKTNLFSDA